MKRWTNTATPKARAVPTSKAISPDEDTMQAQVIAWANLQAKKYPELARLFHVPNGGRHLLEAVKLKRQGVRAGVPDLFLPAPRFGRNGLWIEMKTANGKLSAPQKDWGEFLRAAGYRVEVCRSFDQAREVLLDYLDPQVQYSPEIL